MLLAALTLAADTRHQSRRHRNHPPNAPKVFDLVLFNHEYDTVPLRIAELGKHVDAIIFAQTAFTFSSGAAKASQFPVLAPSDAAKVRRAILNATPAACWSPRFSGDFYPPLKSARSSSKLPWCIQSAVRNMLGLLFERAGGGDDDWALISDADELAQGSTVARLRRINPRTVKGVIILESIHHFKYTLRCAEVSSFTRGPIAVSGKVLRELGAQRARDSGRRSCLPVGYRGSCGRVNRRSWPGSSWQFSNFGGVQSLKYKLKTNSFAASAKLMDDALVLERERGCHDHLDRGKAYDFNVTGWDASHLPHPPDVPRFVEKELLRGRLRHFVDISAPVEVTRLTGLAGDDPGLWAMLPTLS